MDRLTLLLFSERLQIHHDKIVEEIESHAFVPARHHNAMPILDES